MRMTHEDNDFCKWIADGCTAWRRGDDAEGREHFQRACLLWLETLEADGRTQSESTSNAEKVTPLLQQAILAMQQGDIIHATDILEYKVLPLLSGEVSKPASFGERVQ